MPSVKGTETEKNLLKAFAGESQARNRYTLFARQAKKDGFEQIAGIFEETANQETEHARRFFSFLEGGTLEITAAFPAGIVGTTRENLKAAADGEHEEWSSLYPKFGEMALAEGLTAVSKLFEFISTAETQHEIRYRALLKNIEESLVFERKEEVLWQCRCCCYTVKGTKAPLGCPACGASQSHFELFVPNY
ncbi:MAG: rubrerythrin family protein [Planctomycetaceae bacterium]|jgi:rubrerythrin|nr:rubrerythrin family protein [Planctomycetaceae bacterium]